MNQYELCLVLDSKISDEDRAGTLDQAKAVIERFEGRIKDVDEWGKKRLAYEIQKMWEGYYYFIHFDAVPGAPAEIEARMRIMDNVLRYLIVRDEGNQVPREAQAEENNEEPAVPEEA